MKKKTIAYILGSFPGRNESFVINEIKGLQKEGVDIVVCPIHKRGLSGRDANTEGIEAIYAAPIFSPKIMAAHFYYFFRKPAVYFELLLRNKVFGGKKIFWEGVYYARAIKNMGIKHIHAHFARNAADCARIIGKLTNIPFSLTAHQSDIHRCPERLEEKVKEAEFVLTCTRGNNEYLSQKYGNDVAKKIFTIYHGVDINKFYPMLEDTETKDIDVLSIGNLIKVKGFDYLVKAIGLNRECIGRCLIIGEGEERNNLIALIKELGLGNKIEIVDPISHDEVVRFFSRAKVFFLPVTVIDNSPHGIPNVIAEAMAMGLPVIASNVPHIPELIESGENGILVTDKDTEGMATEIERLLTDSELRLRLGRNAREKIMRDFDISKHIQRIAELFFKTT